MKNILTKTQKEAFYFIRGFSKYAFALLAIISVGISLNSYAPILYGGLIDSISNKDIGQVISALIPFGIVTLITVALSSLETLVSANLASKITIFHQKKLYGKIVKSKVNETEKVGLGLLISNLTSDISIIVNFDIEFITTAIFIALNFIVPIIFIFAINIKLAIITVVFLPIAYIIYYAFKRKKQMLFKKGQEIDDSYYQYICNSLQNISSIKLYGIEKHTIEKFEAIANDSYRVEKGKNKLNTLVEVLNSVTVNIFSLILIYVAACLISVDEITLGILMSFNIYTVRLFEGINTIQKLKLNEQPVKVALERLQKINDLENDNYSLDTVIETVDSISVREVFFSYDDETNILNGLTLDIEKNGFYSIVGENGCGKTTLLKLLVKFYLPKSGSILLNNISFSDLTEQEIRSRITYVQKDPFVLNDTLYENIAIGSDFSPDKIMSICAKVGLKDFIESLPEGLNTFLYSDSDLLSSGLRQKMSFARALLHPSPIMIFDEITSDLDGRSERELCKIMHQIGKKHIVISVSHRINTVSMSDYIFILDNGRISDEGTLYDLKSNSNEFASLFFSKKR